MYYEEKLIDGILHWRGTPDGEWQIIPAEKLGERVIAAEAFRAAVAAALAELRQHLLSEYDPEVMPDTMLQRINAAITKLGLEKQ